MDYKICFEKAKNASRDLSALNKELINDILLDVAETIIARTSFILSENEKDLNKMPPADAKYDRLKLTGERILEIASEIKNVAALLNPIGEVLSEKILPNSLQLFKLSVPLGVIGIIYEARPNVTLDVFSLCFKTGNVVILKGGTDADYTNKAIVKIIKNVLNRHRVNEDAITLLPVERSATEQLLNAVGYVDIIIPRGGQNLIDFVRQNSKVPVIETGAGIVHIYADESAEIEKLKAIVFNSKTRRPSVCNSLDCLILHQKLLVDLPAITKPLSDKNVEIFADQLSYTELEQHYPPTLLKHADAVHFGTEFLSLKMAVKTVSNLDEALDHIANYSSRHSEAIVSENAENIEIFLNRVDAAVVYANASTAFTDGAQFGLGAEIGISTQKLHARGPMGLNELTSYKWVVRGNGQIR